MSCGRPCDPAALISIWLLLALVRIALGVGRSIRSSVVVEAGVHLFLGLCAGRLRIDRELDREDVGFLTGLLIFPHIAARR